MNGGITCVLADDHPLMRDSLAALLTEGGIQVVGKAADGKTALDLILEHRPRVAVLDLRMPVLDGAEVAVEAGRYAPETAVVVFTAFGQRALLLRALDAGARGFVLKEAPGQEVVRALTMAAEGRIYVDPTLGLVLGGTLGEGGSDLKLTRRQRDVLRLLAEGRDTLEVGDALSISPETVRTHIRNAMIALNAETRIHAVVMAMRYALIS